MLNPIIWPFSKSQVCQWRERDAPQHIVIASRKVNRSILGDQALLLLTYSLNLILFILHISVSELSHPN